MSSSSQSSYSSSPVLEPVPLPTSRPPSPARKRQRVDSPPHSSPSSQSSQSESRHSQQPQSYRDSYHLNPQVRGSSAVDEAQGEHQQQHTRHNDDGQPGLLPIVQQPEQEQFGLQPTFFGVEPLDEFTRRIGDWIWEMSKGREHVEVRMASIIVHACPACRTSPDLIVEIDAVLSGSTSIRLKQK